MALFTLDDVTFFRRRYRHDKSPRTDVKGQRLPWRSSHQVATKIAEVLRFLAAQMDSLNLPCNLYFCGRDSFDPFGPMQQLKFCPHFSPHLPHNGRIQVATCCVPLDGVNIELLGRNLDSV